MSGLRGGQDGSGEPLLGAHGGGEGRRGVERRHQVDAADPRAHLRLGPAERGGPGDGDLDLL